jgi:hypothetical protein
MNRKVSPEDARGTPQWFTLPVEQRNLHPHAAYFLRPLKHKAAVGLPCRLALPGFRNNLLAHYQTYGCTLPHQRFSKTPQYFISIYLILHQQSRNVKI